MTMQLSQKQRNCQVASQPENRKSSRELDNVAYGCPEEMQKRGRDGSKWLRQEGIQTWQVHEVVAIDQLRSYLALSLATHIIGH
jgi:hypothetical protein